MYPKFIWQTWLREHLENKPRNTARVATTDISIISTVLILTNFQHFFPSRKTTFGQPNAIPVDFNHFSASKINTWETKAHPRYMSGPFSVTKDPYIARTYLFLTEKGLKIRQNTGKQIATLIYNETS